MQYRGSSRVGKRRGLVLATAFVALALIADALSGGAVRAPLHAGAALVGGWVRGAIDTMEGHFSFGRSETQLAALAARAAEANRLQQENDQLRALVNVAANSQGKTAPVVSSLNASPYGTFLIGADSTSDIQQGDLVLTAGGFVIGRVSNVQGGVGIVSEILAPGNSSEAILHGAAITVEGEGGGNGEAEVPRAVPVAPGDVVTVPSLGARAIAVVGAIASTTASAAQTVYLQLPIDRSGLEYVYVTPSHN